jgi:YVTN family beta-propeller protein
VRRVRIAFALVVLCVAAVAVSTVAAGKAKPKPPPNYGPAVKKTIRSGAQPCGAVEGFGSMWVSTYGSSTLQRIDPATNRVIAQVDVGAQPCGLAVGAGAIWINGYGSNSVERVDPQTMTLVAHIPVGRAPYDVLFAAGSVWTTNQQDADVMRIDPATNAVVAEIPVGDGPAGLGFAAGSLWVGSNIADSVFRIDPKSNSAATVPVGRAAPAWLSTRDDQVWVSSVASGVVVRIDPATNRVSDVVKARSEPADGVVDARGLVWVPNRGDNSVSIFDSASAAPVTTIRVGAAPFVLNDGFGDIWSPSFGAGDVRRLRPPLIAEATLAENAGSGEHGLVRLIAVGRRSTRVVVTLTDAPAMEFVDIHGGKCGAFTRPKLKTWRLRSGRGSALVPMPIKKLGSGRYALDVHRRVGAAAYVACANLG